MQTRISISLKNPHLIELLEIESQKTNSSANDILVKALKFYFARRLETSTLNKASEAVFKEWNDPRDSDYDELT
jgi:hypothetical protein